MAGGRVDEVPDNVFVVSSRINSTWGGNLTDMVRARRVLDVIEAEGLVARAADVGAHLLDRLQTLAAQHDSVTEVRGRGLMCAFTMPSAEIRDEVIRRLREDEHVLVLGSGTTSLRVRPTLTVTGEEIDRAIDALDRVLSSLA
jgi:L-lysine 6-transaminase